MPELDIVIVSHGAEALLRRCLASLREHPAACETRVTVVDSGSPDSTPDMVEREFPWVRLERRDNIGFSAANNLVLRENAADAVLLLNPDTEVYEGTLDAALARLRSERRIGMVGVKLVTSSGELDHACKRSFPTPLSALAHFTGIGRAGEASEALSQYRATHLDDDEPGEVDAVNGAFMLCRSEAVREVGLLDEGYWLYMEDLDWCHRFWDSGWKVFYEPAGVALHAKGASSGRRRRPKQEIAFHRGMARFYRRFDAPEHNPLLNAAVYAGIGAKLATSLAITAATRLKGHSGLAATVALLVALFALSASSWLGEEPQAEAATGSWGQLSDAGLQRTEVGAARVGGSIYVVGGFISSETTAAVERYDIERDRWRRLRSMPIAVNHPAVASHGGFLYVYGGYTDSSFGPVTAALQRFDPRSGRWTLLPSSPTPRAAAALAGFDGRLYAVGGAAGGRALTTLETYDVATRHWRTGPAMDVPREHIAAVATADGVYVLGGRSDAGGLNTVELFHPRSRRWARLPHLLHARSGFAAVAVAGRPVAFGGEELTPGGTTIPSVELFDPKNRRWRSLPPMRTPRHGLGGGAMGRRIYALEGGPMPGLAFSNKIEYLDLPPGKLR